MGEKYTDADVALLRRYYPEHGPNWDGWHELLPGRSAQGIGHAARKRGIHRRFEVRQAPPCHVPETMGPVKVCPFCGSLPKLESAPDARGRKWWRIRCDYARCPATVEIVAPTREMAVAKWGRRCQ